MKSEILTHYIEKTLEDGKSPKSVYKFCKEFNMEESEFYKHYSTLEHVAASFWQEIANQTVNIIQKSETPENKSISHDLLSFYFTLFENLTLNRSYILQTLGCHKSKLLVHKDLRNGIFPHLKEIAAGIETLAHKLSNEIGSKISEEALWLQFITIFKYWMNDDSSSFESTDAFIEKSVRAAMELNQHIPTESLMDYGKFIFKEFKKFI